MKYALQALELSLSIGITEEERSEPQMILCDIDFQAEKIKGPDRDNIAHVVNYQDVYDEVKLLAHQEGRSWNLLETFHEDVLVVLEEKFPQVSGIKVSLTKFPFEDGAIMITNR